MSRAEAFELGLVRLVEALEAGDVERAEALAEDLASMRDDLAATGGLEAGQLERVRGVWQRALSLAEARLRACQEKLALRMRASQAGARYGASG